ncbi:hypothetical protein L914_00258 [Phytophthora nicotianae]|uniref:Uncharacterized protein n=2 Tax=Phytophthora nicotianae TaxID=4792 RepID=V9G105_PHYNI|nr:hypothetical protein F443_00291 [Phytophthora nicotianae P1569]ETM56838.1 hypothetical protein L914_00258 [Phytophthora nicotianae]
MNAWLAKVLICPQNNAVDIFEIGQHTARCAYPPTVKLNEKDKDVASYLAQVSSTSKLFERGSNVPPRAGG